MSSFDSKDKPLHLSAEALAGLAAVLGSLPPQRHSDSEHSSDEEKEDADIVDVIVTPDISVRLGTAENEFNAERKTLFATHIWHASRLLSSYIAENKLEVIRSHRVLEFGAGAGLPSIVCAK
jgi:predicted nicotinamide N-methyase